MPVFSSILKKDNKIEKTEDFKEKDISQINPFAAKEALDSAKPLPVVQAHKPNCTGCGIKL